jgi:hypothetical protein
MINLITRIDGKTTYTFVSIETSMKAIEGGFKGPFYGRYVINSIFKDSVLFGNFGHQLKNLRIWKEFPNDGCVPLLTIQQYKEYIKDL